MSSLGGIPAPAQPPAPAAADGAAARSAAGRLVAALTAARDAFAAGDPLSASDALDVVVAACAELDARGARLDPATLAEARALHHACAAAALPLQRELNAQLELAGDARRAAAAYSR